MEDRLLVIDVEESLELLNALSSETRLAMLKFLSGQKLNVNELAEKLSLPQSTVSTNLSILEKAGLIAAESAAGRRD